MATFHRMLSLSVVLFSALMLSECTSDSIPSTLSEPYLFNSLLFGYGTSPAPGTILPRGQSVVLHLKVAYTLWPALSSVKNNLALYVQAFGRDSANTAFSLGAPRDSFFLAGSAGGVITDSLPISITSNIDTVWVQAFVDSIPFRNPVLMINATSWPAH